MKGEKMNGMLVFSCVVFVPLLALAAPLGGEQAAGTPVTIEYYYKLAPGGTSEWLALYKKNHNPILKQLMREGILKSEKLYERRFHAATPAWDYKIVMVWRDWAALEQAHQREPEIIRSLYLNKEEHDQQEKRRWELTVAHWDDVLSEIPLD
jgi:hypothetical protein